MLIFLGGKAKNCTTKDGKSFQLFEYELGVSDENNEVKRVKGSMPYDFAKRYFETCGTTVKDLIGKEVHAQIFEKSFTDKETGKYIIYKAARYLQILDSQGKPIKMYANQADGLRM